MRMSLAEFISRTTRKVAAREPAKLDAPTTVTQTNACEFFMRMGLPCPVVEHPFAKEQGRKWRFDYAWPEHRIALEVEGGVWIAGRHTRGSGFVKDMEKYNQAAVLGWRVLKVQPRDLCTAETVEMLKQVIR